VSKNERTNKQTTKQKQAFRHKYIIHNHILESVTSAKYLDITLQSNLKWSLYYDNIISNGNESLGIFKHNLTVSNTDIKSRAYDAFVRPKPEYSCSVWDPHTNEYKNMIEMMQRRATRYTMNNYHNTSSVNTMIDILCWPSTASSCFIKLLPDCPDISHLNVIRQQTLCTILPTHTFL